MLRLGLVDWISVNQKLVQGLVAKRAKACTRLVAKRAKACTRLVAERAIKLVQDL